MHKGVVLILRMKCFSAVLSCDTVHYYVHSHSNSKFVAEKKPKE